MPDNSWRLFIAVAIPPAVKSVLTTLQDDLRDKTPHKAVRWVNPDGIHLTLKFLGDVPLTKRSALEKALATAAADIASFDISTQALGCFPNSNRPRVVWLGIGGDTESLRNLWQLVETHVAPLGFPTENRPFSPHLTLGRVRREANRTSVTQVGNAVIQTTPPAASRWHVDTVHLVRSTLLPSGAEYEDIFVAPLKASP